MYPNQECYLTNQNREKEIHPRKVNQLKGNHSFQSLQRRMIKNHLRAQSNLQSNLTIINQMFQMCYHQNLIQNQLTAQKNR